MSNISNKLMKFPQNVTVELKNINDKYDVIWVSGEYGTYFCKIEKLKYDLTFYYGKIISVKTTNFHSWLKHYFSSHYKRSIPKINSNLSLLWVKIQRMIVGAGVGFKKYLRVRGVGYSLNLENGILSAKVGYTHILKKKLPINFHTKFSRKSKVVRFRSKSLSKLTLFLSSMRVLRRPDIYKGKGIRYKGDPIRRKPGKRKTKAVGRKNKFNKKNKKTLRKNIRRKILKKYRRKKNTFKEKMSSERSKQSKHGT